MHGLSPPVVRPLSLRIDAMTAQRFPGPIRVFLVDDHPMICKGLASMLDGEHDLLWVGEASNGRDAIVCIPQLAPDVVLIDWVMPDLDGLLVIEQLRPRLPRTRFVVLTQSDDTLHLRRALACGASGCLLKSATAAELLRTIRDVHAGRRVVPGEGGGLAVNGDEPIAPGADLTRRERQLLALMARGLSNQQIADQMGIALPTVKFHITNILSKLQAGNRTEAVLTALKCGLVQSA